MSLKEQIEHRDKVLEMRNFHYENFNKWSKYFYIIVGALFVGYYNVCSNYDFAVLPIGILIIGYIVSLCWYMSNKGYYYWLIHWNNFLLKIEDNVNDEYKIYSKFYMLNGNGVDNGNYKSIITPANISTSKVTLFMSFAVTVMWGVLFIFQLFNLYGLLRVNCKILENCLSFVCICIVSTIVILFTRWLVNKIGSRYLFSNLSRHNK